MANLFLECTSQTVSHKTLMSALPIRFLRSKEMVGLPAQEITSVVLVKETVITLMNAKGVLCAMTEVLMTQSLVYLLAVLRVLTLLMTIMISVLNQVSSLKVKEVITAKTKTATGAQSDLVIVTTITNVKEIFCASRERTMKQSLASTLVDLLEMTTFASYLISIQR
jgi:uncharacterized membrane protein YGL010W